MRENDVVLRRDDNSDRDCGRAGPSNRWQSFVDWMLRKKLVLPTSPCSQLAVTHLEAENAEQSLPLEFNFKILWITPHCDGTQIVDDSL